VLEAVLFDWGNTLVRPLWDDELVLAGHRAALGRDDPEFTGRWRALMLGDDHGHRPYAALLEELGIEDPAGFIEREHEAWQHAYAVLAYAPSLLESLRERGLKTGLVCNAWPDPGWVLRADADALGLSAFFDAMVFSDEVGARKPASAIFLRACSELGVEPTATLFVGDSLGADVVGARGVGMRTVQALWFRADENPEVEPDFRAFEASDVLNVVGRLADDSR
jgi:HAD superfamily hydrolase (TIGR01509 family)